MKQLPLIALLAFLPIGVALAATCEVDCDEGYLKVCVSGTNGACRCACMTAAKAPGKAADLLASLGLSETDQERGKATVAQAIEEGKPDLSLVFENSGDEVTLSLQGD